MKFWLVSIFVVFVADFVQSANSTIEYAPIVQLSGGKVRGIVQPVDGKNVHFYQGIRYGHTKRFEKGNFVDPWTGIYDATKFREQCPQPGHLEGKLNGTPFQTETMSEDCLYLNIWRPAEESKEGNRSVMVFIHGGTYQGGTIFTALLDGRYIAQRGNVIMITIAYRLGALGLITGGDVPANLGLHDQMLALKWIQQNIHQFGGNPKSVTILGESSGSINVGHLVLSPLAKGLFQRAIMQSGGPNSVLGEITRNSALEKTKSFAKLMHCPTEHINQTIACLKMKSVDDFMKATLMNLAKLEFFLPVFGDEVLPMSPLEMLKSGKFNRDIDLIFGVNNNEGSHFVATFAPELPKGNMSIEFAKQSIIRGMKQYKQPFEEEIAAFYTKDLHNPSDDDLKIAIANSLGDLVLICPTILFAEEMVKHSPKSRFYSYRLMQHIQIPLATFNKSYLPWKGVTHGEDVMYLFVPLLQVTPEDRQLGIDMIHTWASFAKSGNPGKVNSIQWEEAFDRHESAPSTKFMALKTSAYKMVSGFYKNNCDSFWKPKMIK